MNSLGAYHLFYLRLDILGKVDFLLNDVIKVSNILSWMTENKEYGVHEIDSSVTYKFILFERLN